MRIERTKVISSVSQSTNSALLTRYGGTVALREGSRRVMRPLIKRSKKTVENGNGLVAIVVRLSWSTSYLDVWWADNTEVGMRHGNGFELPNLKQSAQSAESASTLRGTECEQSMQLLHVLNTRNLFPWPWSPPTSKYMWA